MTKRNSAYRGQVRSLRNLALQNRCPECNAPPGEKCIGTRGSPRAAPHKPRFSGVQPAQVVSIRRAPSSDDRLEQLLEEATTAAAVSVREDFDWGASKCESPIEKILLARYVHPHTGAEWDMRCSVLIPPSRCVEHCRMPPMAGLYLWPQIKIGPHRVDFLVGVTSHREEQSYAIIECDGHDFHERTKEQAQRDKSRDRYLIGRGFRVLRYTGSEIYRDPEAVWEEIIKILLGLCD